METIHHSRRFWLVGTVAASAGLLAATLFGNFASTNAQPPETNSNPAPEDAAVNESNSPDEAVATLAGGCFWCTEAVFERLEGVRDVTSGYIGGQLPNPTYKAVTTGTTGHAEAVEIRYDPATVSFETLLEVFFATHDPTTLNRQGNDIGTQYRSAIFYHDEQQKAIAEEYISQLNETRPFRRRPIVTTLEPATEFYVAEEYHQDYFARNPFAGYCQMVVRPKVAKFQKQFKDKLKKD